MDVVDRLARAGIHVEHGPVAFLLDTELLGQFLGNLKHMPDQRGVFRRDVVKCRDMFPGTNQKVHGRLGPEVFECHYEVVFVHKVGRSVTPDDSAEKTCLLHVLYSNSFR